MLTSRFTVSLLLLAPAFVGCNAPGTGPDADPDDTTPTVTGTPSTSTSPTPASPVPVLTWTDHTFDWLDPYSAWSNSRILVRSDGRVSFYTYGEPVSEDVTLAEEELSQVQTLMETLGVPALAEADETVGDELCCESPGFQAGANLYRGNEELQGALYWTSNAESEAQAELRMLMEALRLKYSQPPPPGEYVFHFFEYGGYTPYSLNVDYIPSTQEIQSHWNSDPVNYCQASEAQAAEALELLTGPALWRIDGYYCDEEAPDASSFSVKVNTGGIDELDAGYQSTCLLIPQALWVARALFDSLEENSPAL